MNLLIRTGLSPFFDSMQHATMKAMQFELDKNIREKKGITFEEFYVELLPEREIALIQEIFEFTNELQHFKYWKEKPRDEAKVQEEFSDIVHFGLSLGLTPEYYEFSDWDITNIHHHMIFECRSPQAYYSNVLGLGHIIGLTGDIVYQAYIEKNKENYKRLANNY